MFFQFVCTYVSLQGTCLHRSEALLELSKSDAVWPGSNQDERVRQAYIQFTAEYKRHGVSPLDACSLEFVPQPSEETETILSACPRPANIVAGHRCNDCKVAWSLWKSPRKQMYPLGKNQYPTLVQKHVNGSASCQIDL